MSTADLDNMPHLDNLKEEIDKAQQQTEESDLDNPRGEEIWTFQFKHKDGRGRIREGAFTNKILTIQERSAVGVLRAKLSGGVPFESLDRLTADIHLMLAHLKYSLIKFPDWAKDLMQLHDFLILEKIYTEVLSHEAYFLGYAENQTESKGQK